MPYLSRFQGASAILLLSVCLAGCGGGSGSGTAAVADDAADTTKNVSDTVTDASDGDSVSDSSTYQDGDADDAVDEAAVTSACAAKDAAIAFRQRFLASNPGAEDGFSSALAMSGDTIAFGAEGEDSKAAVLDGDQSDNSLNNAGAVYLWECKDGAWQQTHYLKANGAAKDDYFGASLALSGDTLIVGAKGRAVNGVNYVGAAFVYRKSQGSWLKVATLTGPGLTLGAQFGNSVALLGLATCLFAPMLGMFLLRHGRHVRPPPMRRWAYALYPVHVLLLLAVRQIIA